MIRGRFALGGARVPATVVSRHSQSVVGAVAAVADQPIPRQQQHQHIKRQHRDQRSIDPWIRREPQRRDDGAGSGKDDDHGRHLRQRACAIETAAAGHAVAQTSRVVDRLIPVEEDLLRRRVASRHAHQRRPLRRVDLETTDPSSRRVTEIDEHAP